MVQLLGMIGILIVGLTLWIDKNSQIKRKEELKDFKNMRDDLLKARKDVQTLLGQLEVVSEKVVGEITSKLEEASDLEQINELEKKHKAEEDNKDVIPNHISSTKEDPIQKNTILFPVAKPNNTKKVSRTNHQEKSKPHKKTAHESSETDVSPKQQMVYAMDKLGCSEAEIAKQMSIGKGEVRLILQLKRKGEEYNA